MNRILTYQITKEQESKAIRDFLAGKGYSRHIRTWIKQHSDSLLLNDAPALSYQKLQAGDLLTVRLIEEESSENIVPVPLPLNIYTRTKTF